ncbi:MAG: hypothetical protein RL358_1298 [Pseudomonadota bacterium]|jgi:hypothetical protein
MPLIKFEGAEGALMALAGGKFADIRDFFPNYKLV